MTAVALRSIRVAGKALLWLVLAAIGLIGLVVVGWVPPELAAMLGSRRRTDAIEAEDESADTERGDEDSRAGR